MHDLRRRSVSNQSTSDGLDGLKPITALTNAASVDVESTRISNAMPHAQRCSQRPAPVRLSIVETVDEATPPQHLSWPSPPASPLHLQYSPVPGRPLISAFTF